MKLRYIVGFINRSLEKTAKTCFSVPKATLANLGSPIPTLDSSTASKTSNAFMLLNAGLGNRTARSGRTRDKECVLCGDELNEVHLLFMCPALEPVREKVGIRDFQNRRQGLPGETVYTKYWNLWEMSREAKNARVKAAMRMRQAYLRVLETK